MISSPVSMDSTGLELKHFNENYNATKEYVYENLGNTVVIDVRTEKEFKGSQDAFNFFSGCGQ